MDHRNLALTEWERRYRDCIAGFDQERSQVGRESNGDNLFVVVPRGFGIGQGSETALDFIRAFDRFRQQIVPEDDIQMFVLDIEVESLGRIASVYARLNCPAPDLVKIR